MQKTWGFSSVPSKKKHMARAVGFLERDVRRFDPLSIIPELLQYWRSLVNERPLDQMKSLMRCAFPPGPALITIKKDFAVLNRVEPTEHEMKLDF